MPLKQIEVVSHSNKGVTMEDRQTDGGGDGGTDGSLTVDILGLEGGAVGAQGDGDNCVTVICDIDNTESQDSGESCVVNHKGLADVRVDMGCDGHTTHVEADTVILGDTNSDSLSDDTRPTDSQSDSPTEEKTDPSAQVTADPPSGGHLTSADKQTNTRTVGKTGKKEKPTPMRKKDSETQETLHPNSPTPLSAERCDSSLSNMDVCRICQCDSCEIQKDSPLVAPCLCAGSLKFIHQACLQKWIKSSDKLSCELCQFEYKMTKKTKPFREWERLDMTPQERRKVVCSVTFHVIAITCVVWSLYVLIDRTTEEVEAGSLLWPFWTKLIVVAIGFTGGVVFMYVQCKMYLTLCKKWRMYNKVILISSISENQRILANHEGVLKISEKQAALEEGRLTNFEVFTIVQETDSV